MPPEPKKPIEELLEASAQARRAEFGGDPQMPNPMRARLQDEIAKLARRGEPAPRSRWFGMSWPRLAMGTALASLLLGAAAIWWQTHPVPNAGARYATQDRLEAKARPAAPSLRRMSAPAESDKLADAKAASDQRSLQTLSEAAPRPASAAAGSAAQKGETIAANLTQQFSQSAAAKANTSESKLQQASKVLDNFQVEQNGRDLRVVDGDGSTYTGRIERRLAPEDTRNLSKQMASAPVAAAPGRARALAEAPANEFYFRASGYNESLKKPLVFEGNYIVTASRPQRKDRDKAVTESDEQPVARIIGTAKVPGQPPMPVRAVTMPSK